MTEIGTEFWHVFKLYRSDLHTKISYHIQNIFFFKAIQKLAYNPFKIFSITAKYRYALKIHRSALYTKINYRIVL